MKGNKTDIIYDYFCACLVTKTRKDQNVIAGIAKGDCIMMLGLISMKIDEFAVPIDPSNPGRFRGISILKRDMEKVLGKLDRLHLTKWGASHFRGALRSDAKRGNKRHIIKLIELLNAYKGTREDLSLVYEECIGVHHRFWEIFSLHITVQREDPAQKRLAALLSLGSFGRVQQGLVFSALRRRYGRGRQITTKKTFAGDDQSSQHGVIQRGDVQVWSDGELAIAVEVKDAVVDETAWTRVEATHGQHDYTLFVLATGFRPAKMQRQINGFAETFAVHLFDYLATLVFTIAVDEDQPTRTVLADILAIYNVEFCDEIEKDASIKIDLDFEEEEDREEDE